MKNKDYLVLSPGPGNVPLVVRKAMAQDMVDITSSVLNKKVDTCAKNLKKIFKTKEQVIILPSNGAGSLDLISWNLFKKGDQVLSINVGFFGTYWEDITKKRGVKIITLNYKLGQTYNLEDVKKALKKHPKIKGVFVAHNETSTGTLQKLEPLGKLTKKHNILLCVDGMSGMVLNQVEFDKWHIDAYAAASTKGFLMSPGLAFVCFSKKAQQISKKINPDTHYLDYWLYANELNNKDGMKFPNTPSISLIYGLEVATNLILKQGLSKLQKEKETIRKYAYDKLTKIGFYAISDSKSQSNTNLALKHPKIKNVKNLQKYLASKKIFVGGGLPDLYSYIRVGFLGKVNKTQINFLVRNIKSFMQKEKIKY